MGHWEDSWHEIAMKIEKNGLNKEFNDQLDKMADQNQYCYTESKDLWQLAFNAVMKVPNKPSK